MSEFNGHLYKNPEFRMQWLAQVLSQGSYRAFQISVIWWINTNTHASLGVGVLLAFFLVASALPSVLLAKPIGRWIDKSNSVFPLMAAAFMGALLLATISTFTYFNLFSHSLAILAGAALSLVHAVFDPSLQKNIGRIVPVQDLDTAVKLTTSTQSIVNFAGAVAGAFLIHNFSLATLFLIGTGMYGLSFAILRRIGGEAPSSEASTAAVQETKPLDFKWDPTILKLVIGFGLVNFFLTPILIILPLYVKKVLQGSAVDLGFLEASVSIGLIFGMFWGQKFTKAFTVFTTATMAMATTGLLLMTPAFLTQQLIYLFALLITGFAIGCNNIRMLSFFQSTIPQENKGLFFSYLQAAISFAVPVGYLVFGLLGDLFTPQTLCFIQGCGIGLLSIYFYWIEKRREAFA